MAFHHMEVRTTPAVATPRSRSNLSLLLLLAASSAASLIHAAEAPTKVPAAVTWGAVGLLAAAVALSALVARRRREPGAS